MRNKLIDRANPQSTYIEYIDKLYYEGVKNMFFQVAISYLTAHTEIVNQPDQDGRTPLMHATNVGCLASVMVLLERKADVNTVCPLDGLTALHMAARQKDTKSVVVGKLLVEHGACIEAVSTFGWTPIMCAQRSHNLDLYRYMLSTFESQDEYQGYLERTRRRQEIVKRMLDSGKVPTHEILKAF